MPKRAASDAGPPSKKAKTWASKVELKYFGGRGLMEVPRQMIATAGLFDSVKDSRFAQSSDAGDVACNLGRMPVLAVGEDSVGQSAAINYYVATELGFMGNNSLEAAQIISFQEHIRELLQAFRGVVPYGVEPTAEALDKWFDQGASDRAPAVADRGTSSERWLKWFLGRMDDNIAEGGFAVGGATSLADFLLYNALAETLPNEQAKEGVTWYRKEPFGSKERTDKAVAQFPKIKAILDRVAAQPGLVEYLGKRGEQEF